MLCFKYYIVSIDEGAKFEYWTQWIVCYGNIQKRFSVEILNSIGAQGRTQGGVLGVQIPPEISGTKNI